MAKKEAEKSLVMPDGFNEVLERSVWQPKNAGAVTVGIIEREEKPGSRGQVLVLYTAVALADTTEPDADGVVRKAGDRFLITKRVGLDLDEYVGKPVAFWICHAGDRKVGEGNTMLLFKVGRRDMTASERSLCGL